MTDKISVIRGEYPTIVGTESSSGKNRKYKNPTEASLGRIEQLTYEDGYTVHTPYISQQTLAVVISRR